jgi:cholesterol transport system auxiliary component
MKPLHPALLSCVLALAATACSTGVQAPPHYHVLQAPAAPAAAALMPAAVKTAALLVTPTTASPFYDGQAIVYSPAPGLRAHYQLNRWTEPPSRRIGTLLTERLRASGAFASVAAATGSLRGALVLDTQLDEMVHDAATLPGSVTLSFTATLSDPARRAVAGQRRFSASVPVATPDAAGAVRAFDAAVDSLLDDVVAWSIEAAAQARGRDADS